MKLSKHVLLDVEDVMELLIRGNENRSKAPTAANETSSRSHAVLQIHVKQRDRASGTHTTWKTAILSIIDLAGSERASATKNRGDRLREGAKINRSLLALGNCINALCKSVNSRHIPYRDSKLTRLLKFSLGGNCKVVMVANISPHPSYYEETHNTLMYANRAKEIKTKVEQNRVNVEAGVEEYKNIIAELEDQVKQLREQLLEARSSGVKGDPSGGRAPFEQVTGSRGLRFLRNQLLPLVLQQELARESALAELEIIKQHSDVCSSVKENVWGSEYDVDLTQLKSFVNRIETECFQRLQQHHSRLRDCEGRLDDLERLVQKVAQKTREMLASRDLEAGEDSWTVNVLDELIAVERYRILKEVATARDRATRILDGHTRNRTDRLLHSFTKILASSATIQSGASSPSRDPSRIRDRVSAVFEDGVVFLQDLLSSLDDRPAGLEQGTWIDEATMDRLLSETDQVISELKEEAAAPVMDPKLFATALRGKSTAAEIRAKRSTAAGSSGPSQAVRTARSQLIFGSSSTETGMAANKPNERPVLKSTVSAINLGASTAARRAISDHQAGPIRISSPQRRKDRKVTPISRATSAEEPLFNPPLPDPKRALAAVASAVRSCRDQWDRPWRQNAQLPKAEPPSLSTSSLASASMPNLAASASTRKVISPNQSGRLSGNPSEGLSDRVLSVDTGLAVEADGRRGRSSKSSSPSIGGGGQAAGGPGLKKIWK